MVSRNSADNPSTDATPLLKYLRSPPSVANVLLDVGILQELSSADFSEGRHRNATSLLLPPNYEWSPPGSAQPRIPLPLCEFLAYKSALVYRIGGNNPAYETDLDEFTFLDSSADGVTDTQALMFYLEDKVFIVFRGSKEDQDWRLNFQDLPTDVVFDPNWNNTEIDETLQDIDNKHGPLTTFIGGADLTRHLGMAISWAAARSDVLNWLARVMQTHGPCPIVLAGHSLGGALANLAALELASLHGYEISAVVTFGAPPVGAENFAAAYQRNNLSERTVRIEAAGDLVPDLMGRWYYKPLHRIRHGYKGYPRSSKAPEYIGVGHLWEFDSAPPLGVESLKRWNRMQRDAMERRLKQREQITNPVGMAATGSSSAKTQYKKSSSAASAPDNTPGQKKNKRVWIMFGLAAAAIAAIFLRLFAKNKEASHSIETRYTIYLSTLSYQQLRNQNHGALQAANAALDVYLGIIRGDHRLPKLIADLPVRIETADFGLYEQALELSAMLDEYAVSDDAPLIDLNTAPRPTF